MTNPRFEAYLHLEKLCVLLFRADELTVLVADLHNSQTLQLRKSENVGQLFQGCQYCSAAITSLAGMRTTLFTRPACPTIDHEGKMENPQTIEAWSGRIEEMAKVLGLTVEEVAEGLLEVADLQYNQAWYLYEQATFCS